MKTYASSEQFFSALNRLIERIDLYGHHDAAQQIREGLSCLNGLTDGWAILMDSIEATMSQYKGKLLSEDMADLKGMHKAIQKVVYRT